MYRRGQLLVVVLACAGLVACAGGGERPAGDGEAAVATSTSFAEEYGELTQAYQSRIEEIQAQGRVALESGDGDVLAVYADLGKAIESASADFSQLQAPEALRPQYQRLVSLLDEQANVLDAVVAAAKSNDDAGVATSLQSFAQLLTDFATAQHALQQELASK